MRHLGRFRLDNPDDLSKWSNALFQLSMQIEIIDIARRANERSPDKKMQRRGKELGKILHKISDIQTEAIHALMSEEDVRKYFHMVSNTLD